jgi:PAS domain S-box-containing protein
MTSVAWKPTLIVSALLLILTYLWMQSTSPELDRRNHMQESLRIIELRDAELMRDLLLARAGLLPNYDVLTRTGQELILLSSNLSKGIAPTTSDAEKVLGKPVNALATTLQAKLTQVEYFKSDNALLRNSVMYFGLVGNSIRKGKKIGAAAKIGGLWQAMFSFMQRPEPILAQEIQKELDQLSEIKLLSKDNQALILHGQLIVDLLPKLDVLMRKIIDAPVVTHLNELQDALNNYSKAVEKRAQIYRLLLYLVAVILVGYLIYQFARLRAHTLALQSAHAHLQQETAERLLAENALRESEGRLRAITDSAHEAIVSADSGGHIVSWNKGATAMFGYPVNLALGLPLLKLIPLHQFKPTDSQTNGMPIELVGVRRDNSEFPLELSKSNWTHGNESYVTVIIRDITARKQLEETARQQELKLIQTNKMTALGTLVSGVAHEINNPNQLILMNTGLLSDAWNDALDILDEHHQIAGDFPLGGLPYAEMRKALPVLIYDIKDGATRIDRIVADLKDFARPNEPDMKILFSLNDVVERAVRLLNHLVSRKTRHFELKLHEPLALLRGDPQQMEQVIVNLLVNALESLPDQDRGVTVKTFPNTLNHQVCLEILDEGVGIDPGHLERLCNPFFTTKQATGGTGLGLAITSSLVRAHDGSLSFSSKLGEGTCARIVFPESLA